jgi:hypothetical protein
LGVFGYAFHHHGAVERSAVRLLEQSCFGNHLLIVPNPNMSATIIADKSGPRDSPSGIRGVGERPIEIIAKTEYQRRRLDSLEFVSGQ